LLISLQKKSKCIIKLKKKIDEILGGSEGTPEHKKYLTLYFVKIKKYEVNFIQEAWTIRILYQVKYQFKKPIKW